MKIGIITDIHSNVIALDAVLKFFVKNKCQEIICCGDIIGIGAFPEETVTTIRNIKNLHCVYGNHEEYLINGLCQSNSNEMSDEEILHHLWQHNSLSDESKTFIRQLPAKLELEREHLSIIIQHDLFDYTMATEEPSIDDLRQAFETSNKDIFIYGHTHRSSVDYVGATIYVNCGSLGCPHMNEGIAKCGVLTIENGVAKIEQYTVSYDLEKVIATIDQLRYPDHQIIKRIFYGV